MAEYRKKGAPQAGLYIQCKASQTKEIFPLLRQMFHVINNSEYEKNMNVVEIDVGRGGAKNRDGANVLKELAQLNGAVALIKDNVDLAKALEADGVILKDAAKAEEARKSLGDDAIIGLRCGASKAKAKKAIEGAADFAGFTGKGALPADPALVRWWTGQTDKPCFVEGALTNDDCKIYVQAGATFLDAGHYIFSHPKGVMQATVNMMYAIELASGPRVVN